MLYKCDKSTNYITKKQEKTIFLLAAPIPLSASFYAIEKNGKKVFLDIHKLQELFLVRYIVFG